MFIVKCIRSLIKLLTDFDIIFHSGLVVLVVFGLIIHPFFFFFCLVDFLRIDMLQNVVKAIYLPKVELGLSLTLYIIMEYYFTLTGYIVFYEDYYGNCDQLYFCFIKTFDWTFKATGSLGVFLKDPTTVKRIMN